MPGDTKLADAAEDSKIAGAVETVARLRASMLLRECATWAERGEWMKGAAEKFMLKDEAEFHLQTNQGPFVVVVRRG